MMPRRFLDKMHALLNEIAVIAPMIGLLGTVLGLFFAFYDTNRTSKSLKSVNIIMADTH